MGHFHINDMYVLGSYNLITVIVILTNGLCFMDNLRHLLFSLLKKLNVNLVLMIDYFIWDKDEVVLFGFRP